MKNYKQLFLFNLFILFSILSYAQQCFGPLKASFKAHTGKTYFFTKDKYYRYETNGDKLDNNGQPLTNWKGLPLDFDAALYNPKNGFYYFFKKDKYYKYDFNKGVVGNAYKLGDEGWKGVPSNIDAAFVHPTNNDIVYFFKGNNYYRYKHSLGRVEYKDLISFNKNNRHGWNGIPKNIDAILVHKNGKIYFFKDNQYYRYNIRTDITEKIGVVGRDGWSGLCFSENEKYPNHYSGFDAVTTNYKHGDIHFFHNDKVFNIKYEKPKTELLTLSFQVIESYWQNDGSKANIGSLGNSWYTGVPTSVDAVTWMTENKKDIYYFFKGDKYYTWSDGAKQSKVRFIKKRFDKIPNNIDAAVHVVNDEGDYIYFFKDDMFYKYDVKLNYRKKYSFIKSDFKGIPAPVDAARYISTLNTIVFYSGNIYYYYSLRSKEVYYNTPKKIPSRYLNIK